MRVTIRAASPDDGSTLAVLFAHVHGPHVAARPDFLRVVPPDVVKDLPQARARLPRRNILL